MFHLIRLLPKGRRFLVFNPRMIFLSNSGEVIHSIISIHRSIRIAREPRRILAVALKVPEMNHDNALCQTFMLSSSPEIWVLWVRVPLNV